MIDPHHRHPLLSRPIRASRRRRARLRAPRLAQRRLRARGHDVRGQLGVLRGALCAAPRAGSRDCSQR